MDQISETRLRLRQMSSLAKQPWIDNELRADLQERRFWKAIRLALLMLKRRLESSLHGPFDQDVSHKLEAIQILLDD